MAVAMALLTDVRSVQASTWRGLVVAPESRYSEYKVSDYSYSQSVKLQIIRNLGGRPGLTATAAWGKLEGCVSKFGMVGILYVNRNNISLHSDWQKLIIA